MHLHFGCLPTLVISSADAARQVMKIQDLSFCDRPDLNIARKLLYDTKDISASPYGEYDLSASSLPVDLSELFMTLGARSFRSFIPWLSWVDRISGLDARVDRVSKQMDDFLQGVVEEHMGDQGIQLSENNNHIEHKEDFVDILLRVQKETTHGILINNDSVKGILLNIYSAGTDTTATVLEWAMTELLRHPSVMKTVQKEQEDARMLLQHLFLAILPLLLLLFLVKWIFFNAPVSNKNLPPSPARFPVLGNFHQLGLLPHRNLQSLARKHGSVMLLYLGSVPILVLSSADAAREVMKIQDIFFCDRPESSIGRRLLYNMKDISVAPYGEYWRQLKSIFILQLASNKRVQSFRELREEETALMVNKIKDMSSSSLPMDLSELFLTLTNDVSCRSAFGKKYSEGGNGREFKTLLREFLELLGALSFSDFIPWLGWVDRISGLDARLDRVSKQLDEFLQGVVQQHIQLGENNIQMEHKEDFVDILLRIQKETTHGISIDNDSAKAILLDIYSAGTDTTATALEWAMTELLRHPNVMNTVQKEVRDILGRKPNITDKDLEKMQYLKAVIKETLRLHPPIPLLIPRSAREDVKMNNYDIAAGTMVLINAWAIGRDSATWNEPEEFLPERFLNSSIDFKGHDFQLIPFGAGRRGCPGIAFAMATNELVLANLLHKFDWKLPNGTTVENLDMSESTGVTIHRKVPLLAVATSCSF
ncbi:Cytochrome P450, E-class, group I [Heracleum sosnowskyi]|uniref:Cytochrome P450, E-class, group I n=1 Tax=Heracleum sosnowskyi TaxID=360622 RepID=A0AAD8HA58_9APIA|nr:Cytochrome P450, E-class, group I [Heracleum sosnowskyi]